MKKQAKKWEQWPAFQPSTKEVGAQWLQGKDSGLAVAPPLPVGLQLCSLHSFFLPRPRGTDSIICTGFCTWSQTSHLNSTSATTSYATWANHSTSVASSVKWSVNIDFLGLSQKLDETRYAKRLAQCLAQSKSSLNTCYFYCVCVCVLLLSSPSPSLLWQEKQLKHAGNSRTIQLWKTPPLHHS